MRARRHATIGLVSAMMAAFLAAASARAQDEVTRPRAISEPAPSAAAGIQHPVEPVSVRIPHTPLGIAKWSSLLASAALALYGFDVNGDADRLYAEVEQTCNRDPDRCAERHADGSFADRELEDRYQRVLALDRRARTALVAGQIGLAASVVLFVLDIRPDATPADIPYVPVRLRAQPDGVALEVRMAVP
ncbi:MAG: hypothetical protein HY704_09160 [Gemmatimonadetes bacterium]|nr:hypothetical protein [Gemmatimonadota bacterium]